MNCKVHGPVVSTIQYIHSLYLPLIKNAQELDEQEEGARRFHRLLRARRALTLLVIFEVHNAPAHLRSGA